MEKKHENKKEKHTEKNQKKDAEHADVNAFIDVVLEEDKYLILKITIIMMSLLIITLM